MPHSIPVPAKVKREARLHALHAQTSAILVSEKPEEGPRIFIPTHIRQEDLTGSIEFHPRQAVERCCAHSMLGQCQRRPTGEARFLPLPTPNKVTQTTKRVETMWEAKTPTPCSALRRRPPLLYINWGQVRNLDF